MASPLAAYRQQSGCYALCAPSQGLGLPVTPPDANSRSSVIGFAHAVRNRPRRVRRRLSGDEARVQGCASNPCRRLRALPCPPLLN